jgi:hypothetical protein
LFLRSAKTTVNASAVETNCIVGDHLSFFELLRAVLDLIRLAHRSAKVSCAAFRCQSSVSDSLSVLFKRF